ncbi:MAG: sigma-54-dependent transcriptional regulator [Fidelibacterota bacterium]
MVNEKKTTILIVDDNASHRLMLKASLTDEGYIVEESGDGLDAVERVRNTSYDLILLDLKMPKMGGVAALKEIKRINPAIPVLIMTAFASVETAVETLKMGASDYVIKPLNIDNVLRTISRTLGHYRLDIENEVLKDQAIREFDYSGIVAQSRAMKALLEVLALSARSDATVLITGETGTGKELIASVIHENSRRRDGPFIKVNCAALTETLLESELFGHEKGAFTGAIAQRKGRFELAHTGTLFLDEIGDMTPATQSRILRVLQEGEFERVGGEKTIRVDVRIIAATNRDLKKEVAKGNFREDLFFRLSVVPVDVPSLRDRPEDIPLLAEHFLKVYSEKNDRLIRGFSPDAMRLLLAYPWPGNVRELENVVERAVILSRGHIITRDGLPNVVQNRGNEESPPEVEPADKTLKSLEKEQIIQVLEETGGNRTRAAAILGISRRTLQYKIRKYQIE